MKANNRPVYLYLDYLNRVVYCNFIDSDINITRKSLKRFELTDQTSHIFVKYYQLRLHPEAKKNII